MSQPSLSRQKQQRGHTDGDKRCRDCRKQANYPFRADRKVADKLACLTVHGKEEVFSLPPCVQDPDGKQCVMHLAALQVDIPARFIAAGVARNRAFQCAQQRARAARVRPLPAVFDADILFVRQKSGQIRCGKWPELRVIVRFDGVHIIVRHFARRVHRDLFKGNGACASHIIVACLRDLIVS